MITITIRHKSWEALLWAKRNCPSYVSYTYKGVVRNTHIIGGSKRNMAMPLSIIDKYVEYHFNDERDASLFALRWS